MIGSIIYYQQSLTENHVLTHTLIVTHPTLCDLRMSCANTNEKESTENEKVSIRGSNESKQKLMKNLNNKQISQNTLDMLYYNYDESLLSALSRILYNGLSIRQCIGKPQEIDVSKHVGKIYEVHIHKEFDRVINPFLARNGSDRRSSTILDNMINHAKMNAVTVVLKVAE